MEGDGAIDLAGRGEAPEARVRDDHHVGVRARHEGRDDALRFGRKDMTQAFGLPQAQREAPFAEALDEGGAAKGRPVLTLGKEEQRIAGLQRLRKRLEGTGAVVAGAR